MSKIAIKDAMNSRFIVVPLFFSFRWSVVVLSSTVLGLVGLIRPIGLVGFVLPLVVVLSLLPLFVVGRVLVTLWVLVVLWLVVSPARLSLSALSVVPSFSMFFLLVLVESADVVLFEQVERVGVFFFPVVRESFWFDALLVEVDDLESPSCRDDGFVGEDMFVGGVGDLHFEDVSPEEVVFVVDGVEFDFF